MSNFFKKFKIGYLKLVFHPLQGYYFRRKARLLDNNLFPQDSLYNLGLVAIFRGEDDYLVEWIEFHKLMGVNHFIMYDNGCSQKSYDILKKYIDNGLLTYISFPHTQGLRDGRRADTLSIQQLAYADCIIRFRTHFKYLFQLDIDEFLFPKNADSITQVLDLLGDKYSRIDINWTQFGSSNHIKKPKGLLIDNFTKSCIVLDPNGVKSIVNTKYLSKIFKYSNVHRFSVKYSFRDMIKKISHGYSKVLKGEEANKLFQLNHYITKSKKEYLKKGEVYSDGWQKGKKTLERFNKLDQKYNEVTNISIQRFIPKITSQLNQTNN